MRIWDADTGAVHSTLRRPASEAGLKSDYHRLASSSDGTRIVASNMETVTLWETSGRFIADLDQDNDFHTEHGIAFQPKGKLIATSGGKRAEIRLWDASTGKRIRAFPSGLPIAWSLAFRPDGAVLAYWRERGAERVLVILNLGAAPATLRLPDGLTRADILLSTHPNRSGGTVGPEIALAADEGLLLAPIEATATGR